MLGCPWKFAKHGKCGTEVSELLPNLARIVDDVCVVRSMHTGVNNHVQGIHAAEHRAHRLRAPGDGELALLRTRLRVAGVRPHSSHFRTR